MTLTPPSSKVNELIRRLDEAVVINDDAVRCQNVKNVLEDIVRSGESFVEAPFLKPAPDRYARRLKQQDPHSRNTDIHKDWGVGQGTPLHDHAGIWCVECVYRGRILVTSYSVRGGDPEKGIVQFEKEKTVTAGVGEAGALIPPFEYHTIQNPDPTPAITIHVYGAEMKYCHIFEPQDGGYLRRYRELSYTAE